MSKWKREKCQTSTSCPGWIYQGLEDLWLQKLAKYKHRITLRNKVKTKGIWFFLFFLISVIQMQSKCHMKNKNKIKKTIVRQKAPKVLKAVKPITKHFHISKVSVTNIDISLLFFFNSLVDKKSR